MARIADAVYLIFMRLSYAWQRLFTVFVYRLLFGYIGSGTTLYPFYILTNPRLVKIGSKTLVRKGCRLEIVMHGQAWTPTVTIGDEVNIEQNVHIICHDRVTIGDRVSITGHCAIIDVSHPATAAFDGGKIGAAIDPARSFVEIGEGSFIGFGTTIMPNVRIGRFCVIGAGAVVTEDIPDYAIAAGVPARVIGRNAKDGS